MQSVINTHSILTKIYSRDIFRIEEQPEPEPYFRSVSARARHNYEKHRDVDVSIRAMEQVDVRFVFLRALKP